MAAQEIKDIEFTNECIKITPPDTATYALFHSNLQTLNSWAGGNYIKLMSVKDDKLTNNASLDAIAVLLGDKFKK
jgi:hypothetical protein